MRLIKRILQNSMRWKSATEKTIMRIDVFLIYS